MDRVALIHKRKKRYMAQLLEQFEQDVQPLLPRDVADTFKVKVRQKLHALALDAAEIATLDPDEEINLAAIELRDRLKITRRIPA